MSPATPPATVPRRRWPLFVLCLAILAGLATVVVVKSCPPTPAPAGKPAEATPPVSAAPAPVPVLPVPVLPVPVAPVDVKADPK
jgi:hypothetical protein